MLFSNENITTILVIGATESNTFNAKRNTMNRGNVIDIVLIKE